MALSYEESKKLLSRQAAVTAANYGADPASYSVSPTDSGSAWVRDSQYVWYDQYSDEDISTVDASKNVTVSDSQINISQEENSQYVPFEMPRYYDGFDLTNTTISFWYKTSDGYCGSSTAVNVSHNGEKIRFAWLIDSRVTHQAGALQFEIRAVGMNEKGDAYLWKSRTSNTMTVLQSLVDDNKAIVLDDSWVQELVRDIAENVVDQIANAQVVEQVEAAESAAARAETAADSAEASVAEALKGYYTPEEIDEKLSSVSVDMTGVATEEFVEDYVREQIDAIPDPDLSGFASKEDLPTNVSELNNDAGYLIEHQSLVGLATETFVEDAVKAVDVSDQLADYAKAEDVYNRKETDEKFTEIEQKLSNVSVDLSDYYTRPETDAKDNAISASVAENASGIAALNKAVAEVKSSVEGVDQSPRLSYEATYGDVAMEDGTTSEYMFTLWETEGDSEPTVKSRFQIMGGGGGSGDSVTLRIAYLDGFTTPLVATADDRVTVKYEFSGEDSAGDTNLDGTASWKVGNRVVATQEVSTGTCEFDLTDYVNIGDNKVLLTITHATGAVATKAWTVKIVDVRLTTSFDETKANAVGAAVSFPFTPYGSIDKTVHFILDGIEISTKTSSAAAAGLSDAFSLPAQETGTHLFELYMTALVNGKTVESNRIVKDVIWFDSTSEAPVIGCAQQNISLRQYEAVNISYTVYDPSTETPSVTLAASYQDDGQVVEEYRSDLTLNASTNVWQFKTDVIGEHTLTIICGDTVKTLTVTVTELGINVSPVTSGLVFDFNPVGRSNSDTNRLWSAGDIAMTVSDNFDWVNGGYQIDENGDQYFCVKSGTSAEIGYELFGDDAKVNGKQIKLVFKTTNVANTEAVFLSCVSDTIGTDKVGIEMMAHEATVYAKTESLPLPYAEDELIEFEINITSGDETPSMVMGYEDGVSTRPLVYDATHDFQQHKDHRKKITLGSADCDLHIYRFKVYNTSLSDRDILNNFIADARSAEEMIARYDRNQIYQDGVLTPEHLAEVCPQLRIIKVEAPHFTTDKDDKVRDTTVECIYKGGDPILDNWVAYDCVHSGQGTSSNNYGPAGRNLDLIMQTYKDYGNAPYIILGDGSRTSKVSLTRESVDVDYFNVKVNIASSENANNALLQRRYNTYNPYQRPIVRDTDAEAAKVKDTMEFQNCVVFIKESDPDLSTHVEFADNNWHFYAMGNIGDSKKTDKTRLTDQSDLYECVLEVMDNTLPNSTMPTGVVDESGAPVYPISESQWGEGNSAYDSLMAETFDEAKSSDKANGLADTYGWRYICKDGSSEERAQRRSFVENEWRKFYKFVVTATDEEFKSHLGDYCVLDSVLFYYLFTLRYTMTDNHAKNMFWHYGKSNDVDEDGQQIRKWDLSFAYDHDTALGIDNYGRMTYRYGYEETDYVDGTSDWVWNAPQQVLFLRIRELFDAELSALYTRLESLGCWSAASLINQFNDWQAEFPEELWRLDIERKYIRTYTSSYINGPAKTEFLKERANGRKKTQRAQYEKSQEKYMSSKFGGTVASADDIILRCSVPNTALAVPANFDMHLTPYSYIYLNVKYNTSPPLKIRAVPNQEYTIQYDSDLADIIEIYSASCLQSIGDLSACYLINGDFSNASKIRELKLGNSTAGYDNSNSMTLGLGSNELLTKLDVQNMSGLTHSLDLSGLKNLEEVYAFGSNVSGVIFADGGNLSMAQLPAIGSLSMKNLSLLTEDGLELSSCGQLSKLVAENSLLDLIGLVEQSPNLYRVRLIGVDWTLEDTALLDKLYDLAGVTNTGGNTDRAILSGRVYVPVIRQRQLYNFTQAWPDLEIEAGTTVDQFSVTFQNDDGTVLDVQYVDIGSKPVDPISREDSPIAIPVKNSTVSTEYTFAGWDRAFTDVYENQVITATYTEATRSYTVKYVSMGATLQETVAEYGTNVLYDGDPPTYTLEESAFTYRLFDRWDKSGFVDGDKTIQAVFDSCKYRDGYFDELEPADMRPVEVYMLTKLSLAGTLSLSEYLAAKDTLDIELGYDFSYDDVEEAVLVSEKTEFNGSTDRLDTGIQLLSEDRDFVLAIDCEIGTGNAANAVLMQCFSGLDTSGFKLTYSNGAKLTWGSSSAVPFAAGEREMLVLRHVRGEHGVYVYSSNIGGDEPYYAELSGVHAMTHNVSLVFGCSKLEDGSYEQYAAGTVYWSKLWYADLGNDACAKLAYWPHSNMSYEVCCETSGAMKRNYLSDNSGARSSITLISSGVLPRPVKMGTASVNEGGWADYPLNQFLNNRVLEAFPDQWRQLMKQVKVKSSIGSKSTEISSSDCYVFVPAIAELDRSQTGEPYASEGTLISHFATQQSRICYDEDGNAVQYWTRSPSTGWDNYVFRISATGAPQQVTTLSQADVYARIMISL